MRLIDADKYQKDLLSAYDDVSMELEVLDNQPLVSAIPIPKRATNGDVLMVMFNVEILFVSEQFNVITVRYDNHSKTYDLSWWNTPYKR